MHLTTWLTFASMVGYAVVYTMFLKRATPQNIVIGGLAGAAPPLLGWTAMTNEIHGFAILLVMIVFTWTPPHFWALAVHRERDYARAKVPMLPVTHGIAFTKTCILLYTILLSVVCLLPYLVGMSGVIYLVGVNRFKHFPRVCAWSSSMHPIRKPHLICLPSPFGNLMLMFVILLVDHYV